MQPKKKKTLELFNDDEDVLFAGKSPKAQPVSTPIKGPEPPTADNSFDAPTKTQGSYNIWYLYTIISLYFLVVLLNQWFFIVQGWLSG